jgi:hypothetical protein
MGTPTGMANNWREFDFTSPHFSDFEGGTGIEMFEIVHFQHLKLVSRFLGYVTWTDFYASNEIWLPELISYADIL